MGVEISELTEANTIQNNDLLPIVQNQETKKISYENFNSSSPFNKSLKYIGYAPADWNEAKTFGIYHVNGTFTNAPSSSTIYGVLIVYENNGGTWTPSESGNGSWIWQEFRDTAGDIYTRHAVNSLSSWSAWNKNGMQMAKYQLPEGTGWFRIANFNQIAYGDILFTNSVSNGTLLNMSVGDLWGYSHQVKVNMCKITNNQMITKARIVYKYYSVCYLELYKHQSESKDCEIYLSNSNHFNLLSEYTAGSIPSEYTAIETNISTTE